MDKILKGKKINKNLRRKLERFYVPFCDGQVSLTKIRNLKSVKYSINIFGKIKISWPVIPQTRQRAKL